MHIACHSRESGNPFAGQIVDARLRGHDRRTFSLLNSVFLARYWLPLSRFIQITVHIIEGDTAVIRQHLNLFRQLL